MSAGGLCNKAQRRATPRAVQRGRLAVQHDGEHEQPRADAAQRLSGTVLLAGELTQVAIAWLPKRLAYSAG